MDIKTLVAIIGIIGVPSVWTMCVSTGKRIKKLANDMEILKEAQQKQMARDLTVDYKEYMRQGWIDTEDLDLWEENYQKYHALGANGIMDSKRSKLLALPNIDPQGAAV